MRDSGRWTRRRHVHYLCIRCCRSLRDQQLRLLAVGSDVRSAPRTGGADFRRGGLAGINIDLWHALLAPADTPADIIGR